MKKEKPQGILGYIGKIFGLFQDSRGLASSSWTVHILAHIPILALVFSLAYKVVTVGNITISAKTPISLWPSWPIVALCSLPFVLSWIGWLIHHNKLLEALLLLIDAVGRAIGQGKGNSTIANTVTNVTTAIGDTVKQQLTDADKKEDNKDTTLPATGTTTEKPKEGEKVDPNSLPVQKEL